MPPSTDEPIQYRASDTTLNLIAYAMHAAGKCDVDRARQLVRACVRNEVEGGAIDWLDLADVLADMARLALEVEENGRELYITSGIVHHALHPHEADKLQFPSVIGAVLGTRAARLVPAHARARPCEGCAYRAGTLANQCENTQEIAQEQLEEGREFMCHIHRYDHETDTAHCRCIGHQYARREEQARHGG